MGNSMRSTPAPPERPVPSPDGKSGFLGLGCDASLRRLTAGAKTEPQGCRRLLKQGTGRLGARCTCLSCLACS